MRLILWLVYVTAAWCIASALVAVLVGIICLPVQFVIQIIVPIWSASTLKKQMEAGLI